MSEAGNVEDREVLVSFGPSQTGKSTMLGNLILPGQGEPPEVGDGRGESVTLVPNLRRTEVGLMLDCPGWNDTRLHLTNEEAGRSIAVAGAASGATKMKFMVFESLSGDTMQLRRSIEKLVNIFGANALNGMMVVASKADVPGAAAKAARLDFIRGVMIEMGIEAPLVDWQNFGLDDEGKETQLHSLQDALGQVEAVSVAALEDIWKRQRRLAQELHDIQTPRTKNVDVEELIQVPYDVQKSYIEQEPYDDIETYNEQEPYQTTETKSVPVYQTRAKWAGRMGKITGRKKTVGEWVNQNVEVEVTKFRQVTRTRNVTRYRPVTRYRTVTMYQAETRVVQQEVEYTLPLEDFYQRSLDQILAETRQMLTGGNVGDVPEAVPADARSMVSSVSS